MRKMMLSPSVFAADITNLKEQIGILEKNHVEYLHVDVMDGHFVSRIAYGADHIRMIKAFTSLPLDVHLMVTEPERHLDAMLAAGADIITIHQESTDRLYSCMQRIKDSGVKAGVVLSPATSEVLVEPVLDMADMVLVMTVNPGEGKQSFIPEMLPKIKRIKALIAGRDIDIEVDGSIDDQTATLCREAGANVFVSGGYVFNGDIGARIAALKKALRVTEG